MDKKDLELPESELSFFIPDLTCVITWLEYGCSPQEAVKELRIYQQKIQQLLEKVRSDVH